MARITSAEINETLRASGLNNSEIDKVSTSFLASYGNYATKDQLQEYIKAYFFSRGMNGSKETETTKKVEAEEVDTNNNEGWCELVTDSRIMKSKTFPYTGYVIGVATGNFNQEKQDFRSYSYKNTLKKRIADFLEEAEGEFPGGKIPAVKTVEKHLNTIIKCDIPLEMIKIENTPNGIVYKLRNRVDNHYYVQLPYRQIKELVVASNKNMIKLFVVLKYELDRDCKTFKTLDRKYLARQIGLSDASDKTVKSIGTMLVALAKLGYIEIRQTTKTDYDEKQGREIGKKINSYRLRSLEEYDQINLIARGILPNE